jgi:lysocardiolipin and lysophospholipid acyltransferase
MPPKVDVGHRPLGKVGGPLFCVLLFVTSFYGAVFLVGPALSLIYVWPWLYRRVIDRIVAFWLIFPIALLEKVFRVKFFVKGDGFNYMDRTLIVMNHRTRVDWMLFWPCLFHCARLRKLKILLKSDLKYIPGPGWAMQAAGFFFLERKWERDRPHMAELLHYFNDPCIDEPLILLLFPEGTDLTSDTKSRSDKFAAAHQLPEYNFVLHPRTTGFCYLVSELRAAGAIDSIHDITVGYPAGLIQDESDLADGKMPKEVHFSIKRYPIDTVPTGEKDELSGWLNERWAEKETKLKQFYLDGQFHDVRQPYWDKRPISIWIALIFWPVFSAYCSYLLVVSNSMRVYGLALILFYVIALRAAGGVERLEMAVFQAMQGLSKDKAD